MTTAQTEPLTWEAFERREREWAKIDQDYADEIASELADEIASELADEIASELADEIINDAEFWRSECEFNDLVRRFNEAFPSTDYKPVNGDNADPHPVFPSYDHTVEYLAENHAYDLPWIRETAERLRVDFFDLKRDVQNDLKKRQAEAKRDASQTEQAKASTAERQANPDYPNEPMGNEGKNVGDVVNLNQEKAKQRVRDPGHQLNTNPETLEQAVKRLAALSPLEYEQRRKDEADKLKVRVAVLDREVEKSRPKGKAEDEGNDYFPDIEPCTDPVDAKELADEIRDTINRFCVLPDYADIAMTLWVLHAHAHDCADISPILSFTSPEKRCGKSTAMSVMTALVPKALHTISITSAALFRVVDTYSPTVMIDEADTFLEQNEELRGIINGGHNRLTAYVWRCEGEDHKPVRHSAWAPKCLAMIGDLPGTIEDRSIIVRLRRKASHEATDRFRADRLNEFDNLRSKIARWVQDADNLLRSTDPELPDALNDRAQDNARPLVAIADTIGGDWPDLARNALIGLVDAREGDEKASRGVMLLRDISKIMAECKRRGNENITSADLIVELNKIEESPWAGWSRGKGIQPRGVSNILDNYGIKSRRNRDYRYYSFADFDDAFERYLRNVTQASVTDSASVTPSVTQNTQENKDFIKKGDAVTLGQGGASGTHKTSCEDYRDQDGLDEALEGFDL